MSSLTKLIQDQFSNTSISTVQRKYFNETKGTTLVCSRDTMPAEEKKYFRMLGDHKNTYIYLDHDIKGCTERNKHHIEESACLYLL